jgi:hypothetical protein
MVDNYQAVGKNNWLDGIGPTHEGNASTEYLQAVLERLEAVDGQPANVIRDELQRIGKELSKGLLYGRDDLQN